MFNIIKIILTISNVFALSNLLVSAELEFSGDITAYGAKLSNQFCGFKENSWNYDSGLKLTGAINGEQIDNSLTCGMCALVEYKDKKEVILLDNICPECKKGDIDLSHEAWKKLVGDDNYSRYKAKWSFVDCDKFSFKEKGIILQPHHINYWWLAITPSNMKCGVETIQIMFKNGNWISMDRDNNKMNGLYFIYHAEIKPPFKFKLISRIGDELETEWYDKIENLGDIKKQFACDKEIDCGFNVALKNNSLIDEKKEECKCNLRRV